MTDNNKKKSIATVCIMGALFFGLSLWCVLKPETDFSDSERRELAKLPELSAEMILSGDFMEDFESYTVDQFPLRDSFRTLKSISEFYAFRKMDNNGIYIVDGYASKLDYDLNPAMLDHAAERFSYIYESYMKDKDMNVYFSIIPDKNYFLAEDNGYPALDYDTLISTMREKTDYMEYIDVFPLLAIQDYYMTDTHWRQEMILDIAESITTSMGNEFNADFTQNVLDTPFYGVYCGQSALPIPPDEIIYLTNDVLDSCIVTSYDTGSPVQKSVYDMEKAYGKDAYEMFLSGSDALLVVENPNALTDKELIVFRDSFGSSLIPLLMDGYAKVTVVDIRYIQSGMLGNFIDFTNQDVLFMYSTLLLNSSLAMK